MKYVKAVEKAGVTQFLVDEPIGIEDFKRLMVALASKFRASVEWIAMPEAEIGKIRLGTSLIYAKLDFAYGLEINCENLSVDEISNVESALSQQ